MAVVSQLKTSPPDTRLLDQVIVGLHGVVAAGAPVLVAGKAKPAVAAIESVERARRLAAVAAVDVLHQIHTSRVFYDQGHANARIMYAHIAGVSGAEAHRLDKIRRMTCEAVLISQVWRAGDLPEDKAALLGEAFANPRTRTRFLLDQKMFLKQARRYSMKRLKKKVAGWIETHDMDGATPAADPTHERRYASLVQDHFAKSWKLDASLGSMQGSRFNEVLRAYLKAEFLKDWAQAKKLHGDKTCHDLLPRTHNQRMADALEQMAEDAAQSNTCSVPVKRVHNIVYQSDTWEELLRRWVQAPARILDPNKYNISDIDGHPLFATTAFADSLVQSVRRVIQNAAGVTINMSKPTRLFKGLARLGVILTTTECYWPGCCVPTSQCHIDHLRPAAQGGITEQINGLPACPRHNWFKERGYTVFRATDGTITITTPTGETVH